MSEYKVRNCPASYGLDNDFCIYVDGTRTVNTYCNTVPNCLIKRVIEKCKGAVFNYSNLEILRTACETSEAYGKANIAEQILQLFDIEEVRE